MARVKLRCAMGCPGLKSSYQEKGLCERVFSVLFYSIIKFLMFRWSMVSELLFLKSFSNEQMRNVRLIIDIFS